MSIFGDYSLNNLTQAISIQENKTMDNKKFEQLIDLIINENEEQARALFHDIVVEKSREIYESMMYEEADEGEEQVDEAKEEDEDEEQVDESLDTGDEMEGLMDEISGDEQGMTEEDDEFADIEIDSDDEMPEGDLEDRVVDLEDKLDQLMAEFESQLAGDDDMGDDEDMDMGDDDMGDDDMGDDEGEDDAMMEAVQLQKVSVTHGDNGQNTKSPTLNKNSKISDNGAKPVKFDQGGDSTKGGTQGGLLNPTTKDVKGAGQFKNAPGNKNVDLTAAPKAKAGDDGADAKSPVAESKKTAKKIVK